MVEDKGMNEMMREIHEHIVKTDGNGKTKGDKDGKEFKLPFGKRFGSPAKIKKNYVLTLQVDTNRYAELVWKQIDDNSVRIDKWDKVAAVTPKNIIMLNGKIPLTLIHKDIAEAYDPAKQFDAAAISEQLTMGEKVIFNEAKKSALALAKKAMPKALIWILILGGIGALVAYNFLKG